MSSNPCAARGYNYNCSVPTPRSSFSQEGPLCDSVAQFLYDPANCDKGYWCGCTTVIADDCLPTNDNDTQWMGHYTTTDTDGNEIVLQGLVLRINEVIETPFNLLCREGYYCPGSSDTKRCVDLCPPKFSCEDPGELVPCPKGSFCPIATTVPKECSGLESCEKSKLRRFEPLPAMAVMAIVIVAALVQLFVVRCFVVRRARKDKAEKLSMKKRKADEEPGEVSDEEEGETQEKPVDATKLSAPDTTIDIDFKDLNLSIPNVGTIMRGVSGSLMHGELTAIMGPSGAGKTTFLTLMSGKVDRTGGSLKVNGEETELTRYRRIIGFVPQEDVMIRDLTVEENIRHSALMRLPTNWSKEKKLELVDETIESLEIDHIRDSVVGDEHRRGISGGQRKRVNIALEMVMKPSLLCLDEPTSGLDSTTSLAVLQNLKELAKSGINVVSVLHQPKYEIFLLFDKILLLGKGGRTVYYGSAPHMTEYFEQRGFPLPPMANPADYYLDVLSGVVEHPTDPDWKKEDLFEEWLCAPENPDAVSAEEAKSINEAAMAEEQNENKKKGREKKGVRNLISRKCSSFSTSISDTCKHVFREFREDRSGRQAPGVFSQFLLLLNRTYRQRVRNPWRTVLTVILMIISGGLIPNLVPSSSVLYNGIPRSLEDDDDPFWQGFLKQNVTPVDQIPSILSSVYFFLLIISCLSVNVFGGERPVFFRETASGQIVTAYWAAKTLETMIWIPLYGAAFVLVGYTSEAWFLQSMGTYWVFFFLDIIGFYGFGMLASLLIRGGAALLSLVFGIIVIIFFGGTTSGKAPSISSAFFIFWSTQGLAVNEYQEYSYAFDVEQLNANYEQPKADEFGDGLTIVGEGVGSGFDLNSSFARNAGLCFFTGFAWHLLVLWTLKTRDHKKQR